MSSTLRPLGVAEMLDGAVRLVRSGARTVFLVAVPFAVLRAALGVAIGHATLDSPDSAWLNLLGGSVVLVLLGTVLGGLLAPFYGALVLGRALPAPDYRRRLRRRGGALLVLAVLVAVGEAAGLVALVVPGVWLWGVWAVTAPVLMLENVGPVRALRRSARLVRGFFWRTWGIRALGWVLTSVLAYLITLPFQALAGWVTSTNPLTIGTHGVSDAGVYLGITAVGTLLSVIAVAPISAAVDLLLYLDLRMRAEGMDIVMTLPPPAVAPA